MKRTTLQRRGMAVATLATACWLGAAVVQAQVGGAGGTGATGGQVGGQLGTGQIGTGAQPGVGQRSDLAPLRGAEPGVETGIGVQPGVTTQPGVTGTGTQPGITTQPGVGTGIGTQPGATRPGVIQQPQMRTGGVPQQRSLRMYSPEGTTTGVQQPGLSRQQRYEHGLGVGGEYGAQTGFEQQRGPADDFQRERMAQRVDEFEQDYPYDRPREEFDETTMPRTRDTGEDWRYRWWNGRWWYWLPEGQWVYWDGIQWREPARTVGYRYSTTGPRWTGYAGQTSYYWGDPYGYGRGWASPWHRGWGYSSGYPGWGTGYYDGWGTGYRTGWGGYGRGWDGYGRGWDGYGRGGVGWGRGALGRGVYGPGFGIGRGGAWFGF